MTLFQMQLHQIKQILKHIIHKQDQNNSCLNKYYKSYQIVYYNLLKNFEYTHYQQSYMNILVHKQSKHMMQSYKIQSYNLILLLQYLHNYYYQYLLYNQQSIKCMLLLRLSKFLIYNQRMQLYLLLCKYLQSLN